MAILNDRIKNRRKLLNKTLLELAEYIGVKEATMQRYESGEIKSIPYDNIVLISECLDCSPQYLMGWSNNIKAEINFTSHEIDLITAYRNQPAMQGAVDKLLGVSSEPSTVISNEIIDDMVNTVNTIDKNIQKAKISRQK